MYQSLELFRTADAMARHAGARQAVVARNVANADTPGYRAQSIAPFADTYRDQAVLALRTSRPGHMTGASGQTSSRVRFSDAEPSPNGNTVSIELEMLDAVEVEREHNRALAIYKHALGVIRTSLGR